MSKRRRGPTPPRPWRPMQRCDAADPEAFAAREGAGAQMWANDRYTVILTAASGEPVDRLDLDGALWLSIRRNDRKAAVDWRDFQRIKNEVVGPEREAFELYPAESRIVDTANQYHLWVMPTGVRLPVGWDQGRVVDEGDGITVDGVPLAESDRADWTDAVAASANARQRPGSTS